MLSGYILPSTQMRLIWEGLICSGSWWVDWGSVRERIFPKVTYHQPYLVFGATGQGRRNRSWVLELLTLLFCKVEYYHTGDYQREKISTQCVHPGERWVAGIEDFSLPGEKCVAWPLWSWTILSWGLRKDPAGSWGLQCPVHILLKGSLWAPWGPWSCIATLTGNAKGPRSAAAAILIIDNLCLYV